MGPQKVLEELIKNGFEIEKISDNEFICYDNGRFGFVEEQEPFTVDSEELLEIYESYISE